MTTFVFCTQNQHKIREVSQIMDASFNFLKMSDVGYFDNIEEPFFTLEENAAIKAKTVFQFCGMTCFAEDTGLFIHALHGEPGVLSARYAGEPTDAKRNIDKVLQGLEGVKDRKAYFKTVISLVSTKGEWYFEGICNGQIATEISGQDGFGYDPIFIPDAFTTTFADLDPMTKNSISHRKKAFDSFADFLHNHTELFSNES